VSKEAALAVNHLFAGIPVADYHVALTWYERLLGRPPDVVVNENEAMWQVAIAGWIYVVGDVGRAGNAILTLLVDDLEGHVAELAERGLAAGAIETLPGGRKATIFDPEGNTITFGEVPDSDD
jgi:predicted enzyme related to lactoylglutathione lyase